MNRHTPNPALLDWYDEHARDFPWRVPPQDPCSASLKRPDPYRVWVSEVMLQQTTTAHATGHFERFMAAFPDKEALAEAPEAEIMRLWAGLGYYARARNLHACARVLAGRAFPEQEAQWRALPGIGAYTAAAIIAIAFERAAVPVDANIARIVCRVFGIADRKDLSAVRTGAAQLLGLEEEAIDSAEPVWRMGDRVQALMDVGARVCMARKALCGECPLQEVCVAGKSESWREFPAPLIKKPRPLRYGAAFALIDGERVQVQRRPGKALLGGMLELPGTLWDEQGPHPDQHWLDQAPCAGEWESVGSLSHVFTHFRLELSVFRMFAPLPDRAQSVHGEALKEAGLASLFVKAARRALAYEAGLLRS